MTFFWSQLGGFAETLRPPPCFCNLSLRGFMKFVALRWDWLVFWFLIALFLGLGGFWWQTLHGADLPGCTRSVANSCVLNRRQGQAAQVARAPTATGELTLWLPGSFRQGKHEVGGWHHIPNRFIKPQLWVWSNQPTPPRDGKL